MTKKDLTKELIRSTHQCCWQVENTIYNCILFERDFQTYFENQIYEIGANIVGKLGCPDKA